MGESWCGAGDGEVKKRVGGKFLYFVLIKLVSEVSILALLWIGRGEKFGIDESHYFYIMETKL